jgi:HK97 family phage major capsid protein
VKNKERMRKALEAARDIAKAAEDAGRELTGDERTSIKAHMDEANSLRKAVAEEEGDAELRKAIADFGNDIGLGDPAEPIAGKGSTPGRGKSIGERVVGSDAFTGWLKQFPNGRIPEGSKGITSPPVEIGGLKTLITGVSDTSAGGLVVPDRYGFVDVPSRPLTIRDLVTVGQTGSDTVEFVRQGARTNNAAAVAEATSSATIGDGTGGTTTAALGGLKPESGFALEKVIESVKTLAHWIPATKRAMSDAGQIRTIIDNFLATGLEEELEDQMVTGDGTGENFEGILNTAGTTAQAWDTNLLVTTRKAKTKVRTVGRARPSAYVFNPEDNEQIDLLRDESGGAGTGAFLFGGPAQAGVQTLWGLPRIESEAVPVGTGLVADWKLAVLWDREQAAVQVSDSHADFFVRNLLAFLAEMRAAFGVLRPAAFVEIDLTA